VLNPAMPRAGSCAERLSCLTWRAGAAVCVGCRGGELRAEGAAAQV